MVFLGICFKVDGLGILMSDNIISWDDSLSGLSVDNIYPKLVIASLRIYMFNFLKHVDSSNCTCDKISQWVFQLFLRFNALVCSVGIFEG